VPDDPEVSDNRKRIVYDAENLAALADMAEDELSGWEADLYQHGATLVHIVGEPQVGATSLPRVPRIRPGSVALFRDLFSRRVVFTNWKGSPISPPMAVFETIMARGPRPKFRRLTAVKTHPCLRPGSYTILDQAGHDAETGIVYRPQGVIYHAVPVAPTKDQASTALDFLVDLVSEFPFESEFDRAVMLAAYLSPALRSAAPTWPGFGFDATAPGSGKTTAARGLSVLADGGQGAVLALPREDESETHKVFDAALGSGLAVVILDNLTQIAKSDSACAALTSSVYMFRPLGRSETISVSNQTIVAFTGNNLTFQSDLALRILVCRLDPGIERADTRRFSVSDYLSHVRLLRPKLITAALTIVRAYIAAGSPRVACQPWSRYPEFDELVRAPLLWLGEADVLETINRSAGIDPDRQELQQLLDSIVAEQFVDTFTVAELVQRAQDPLRQTSDLRRSVLAVAGDGERVSPKRLGKYLARYAGRIVDDLQLVRQSTRRGVVRWQVFSK